MPAEKTISFDSIVYESKGRVCSNCGSYGPLTVELVVPETAGGQRIVSNSVVLCRKCSLARDAAPRLGEKAEDYVVSVWLSRYLREKVENKIYSGGTFSSWSSLSRYFIAKYIECEHMFDDLPRYQDTKGEVKVTIRVEHDSYAFFLSMVRNRGMTATDALRGLYMMWLDEM